MTRSATDIMQEILSAAVLDALAALKVAAKGMPNTLLRDIGAIHANTTFADLPGEVQRSIAASVRAAFTRLLKEGYSVSPAGAAPPRVAPNRHDVPRHGRGPRGPERRGKPGGGERPPPKGGRPRGRPGPRGK